MFRAASESATLEYEARKTVGQKIMRLGVDFLDDALRGIFPDDLILLGAPSGIGKTQLCCNIALSNLEDGRQIHYIALEASEFEIERRLKFPLVAERYFGDPDRPTLETKFNYTDWILGKYTEQLAEYEESAIQFFKSAFTGLHLHYKGDKFGVTELIKSVIYCAEKTDLILIDHVHYFDLDDDNENRAIKEIAKTVRNLAIEEQRPIILVAHLRKRDRNNDEICAGLDEFHGTSDLYKIATRVITIGPGKPTEDGGFETFFRIPKNRLDGGVTRFLGREIFNPKVGGYEKNKYKIGWATATRQEGFVAIDRSIYPAWARHGSPAVVSDNHPVPRGLAPPFKAQRRYSAFKDAD